ncbi:zinc finger protein 585A-like [Cydia amplana]|uniref:zinc finger protein 585A-like n=2 Tax=Cydia amplana TaxID=1869771 RepID=UPI002FE6A58B
MSVSRVASCFICSTSTGARNTISLIQDTSNLQSGKKLLDIVSEIAEKPLTEEDIHSTVICKKCSQTCKEYDDLQVRLKTIKSELHGQINKSSESPTKPDVKKVVLPASKLYPLPPDFVLNVGRLPAVTQKAVTTIPSKLSLKVTVGSSVLTQSIKTTPALAKNIVIHKTESVQAEDSEDLVFEESSLPKDFISSVMLQRIGDDGNNDQAMEIDEDCSYAIVTQEDGTSDVTEKKSGEQSSYVLQKSGDQSMFDVSLLSSLEDSGGENETEASTDQYIVGKLEILSEREDGDDEERNLLSSQDSGGENETEASTDQYIVGKLEILSEREDENDEERKWVCKGSHCTIMFDVSLLSSLEDSGGENEAEASTDQYIVGKLEILSEREDEDDEEQTIVMSEENSIFRVVSGQKLVYGESGLELLSEDADTQADSQDDEDSQIELQVSGDEETANAIIAAAREQGGAFIKVQSGEMYRVKSVQSKPKEEETDFTDHIVVKEDGVFRCVLCKKSKAKGSRTGRCAGDADFIMRHTKTQHDARVYICRTCDKVLRRRDHYIAHMALYRSLRGRRGLIMRHTRTQHDARVYICRTCDKVLRRRDHYIAHVAQHAKESSSQDKSRFHECDICHKKYSSKTLLMEHMNLHNGQRPYTCHICHKSFASKYTHQSHLKTHLDRPRPFKCDACGKCFFTLQNLNQHHKTHSGLKEFECNICGKAFGTQHNLEMHGVVHSGQKPFVCAVCGKGFARRAEVKDHMRIHTGERPFACEVCGATFSQRSNLHSHKRATHYDDKRYKCDQCPKRFKRRRLLDYHIKASHTGERPLKCEICKATFVYPEHYKKHARIHSGEKPYVCEVCGKSFNSRDNRNTHRFVHSDKKPYECLVCGAGYMRKRLLYAHMNTQVCGKSFNSRDNRNTHRFVHSDKKPYECLVCGAGYMRKRLLYAHMNTQVCGKSFNSRDNRNTHRFVHSDKKPCECLVCGAGYMRKRLLYAHMNTQVCGKSFNSRDNRNTHRFVHSDKKPCECLVCGAGYMRKRLLYAHMNTQVCGKSFNSRDNRNTHRFVHSDKKPCECLVCGAGYMRKRLLYAHMNTQVCGKSFNSRDNRNTHRFVHSDK